MAKMHREQNSLVIIFLFSSKTGSPKELLMCAKERRRKEAAPGLGGSSGRALGKLQRMIWFTQARRGRAGQVGGLTARSLHAAGPLNNTAGPLAGVDVGELR